MTLLKNKTKNYKPLPTLNENNCFGCSADNPHGLQMKFLSNGQCLLSKITVPEHLCGWSRLVHGGVIATLLDEIMSWTAIFMLKKIILTKSMNIDFLKPAFINNKLTVEGKVIEQKSKREAVISGFLYNEQGKMCAKSQGTFALFTPEAALRMKIMNQDEIDDLKRLFI